MSEKTQALVEHYQKTYELTYALWQQRNKTFLYLLAVIGAATLLTFNVPQTGSLMVDLVAKVFGVSGDSRLADLRKGFPLGLLQSILLLVVFYLMVNLYHRALYILRNYRYLAKLEGEIRKHLELPDGSVSFTRESSFYWSERARLAGLVKWVYIVMLGLLLIAFLGGRIVEDFKVGNTLLAIVDIIIAVPTLIFFIEFARSSVSFDKAEVIVGQDYNNIHEK